MIIKAAGVVPGACTDVAEPDEDGEQKSPKESRLIAGCAYGPVLVVYPLGPEQQVRSGMLRTQLTQASPEELTNFLQKELQAHQSAPVKPLPLGMGR